MTIPLQALRQVFRLLGSSKLLGSPLGLFSNISAGVKVGMPSLQKTLV